MKKIKKTVKYVYKNSLIRFLVVGGLGTFLNLAVFFIFADFLGVDKNISSIFAFIVAVSQNYILNHIWSFKKFIDKPMSFGWYMKYSSINILGLVVNLVVLNLIDYYFNLPYKVVAQFFGISSGTTLNYIGSKFFVFRKFG